MSQERHIGSYSSVLLACIGLGRHTLGKNGFPNSYLTLPYSVKYFRTCCSETDF